MGLLSDSGADAPGQRGLEQVMRDDAPRGGVQAWAGVRARAAVQEAGHGRRVRAVARKRAPEVRLLERRRARVDVPALEVAVAALEPRRREHGAPDDRLREVSMWRASRATMRSA